MKKHCFRLVLAACLASLLLPFLSAQGKVAPPEIAGKAVYIPFPVKVSVDGKIDDWAAVPLQTVNRGPNPSKDPAEDGSFQFALAADVDNIYILMLAKDKNIISGQHGGDSWNEDSLEFYFNFGDKLAATTYGPKVAQYRIMPRDIGNTDPSKLTISGQNVEAFPPQAKLFKTKDGWGFEASVKYAALFKAAHGKEIGFQAQLNGASEKDRNVKLIWSDADKADNSWQNPSLFGRALFFQVGSKEIPQPSLAKAAPAAAPVAQANALAINQTGYFAKGQKTAILANPSPGTLPWTLFDAGKKTAVASGDSGPGVADELSGDMVHLVNFSSFTKPGSYYLEIGGHQSSVFKIGNDALASLAIDSLAYFYRTRSGIELKEEYAGAAWARPAGHLSDAKIAAFQGKDAQGKQWQGYDYLINGVGGWYDAGDFGKYVVNGGISVWTLQNAYERNPMAFADGQLAIPENKNGVPDILDEARWELEFMLNMQIPQGKNLAGMSFHKLHDRVWSGVPNALPEKMDNNNVHAAGDSWGRFVFEPSTAATLNLAANAAQAARLWRQLDPAFAKRCLDAAAVAWKAALANPSLIAGNVPGNGGGNYDDTKLDDDFYWAAAELYVSTGAKEYFQFLKASPYFSAFPGLDPKNANAMNWADTAALGSISLAINPKGFSESELAQLNGQIMACADRYLQAGACGGYLVPMETSGFVWGSNSGVLNNAIILAVAYDISARPAYRNAVVQSMNYILGENSLRKSFVTGYGSDPVAHPHHRVWGNNPDSGYPAPPPGVVSGGPNVSIQDPEMTAAKLASLPIAKRYLDKIGSYATNEVAINWNAPLAWVANWLNQQYNQR